jgi:hypothetical protein
LIRLAQQALAATHPRGLPRALRFDARAVHAPDGSPHHWLVAVVAGERLAGWVRFTPAQALLAVSLFPHRPDHPEDWPLAADWLDPTAARTRAAALAGPREHAGEPMLGFDGHPDRIAWIVPLAGGAATRRAFVAGAAAWVERVPDGG